MIAALDHEGLRAARRSRGRRDAQARRRVLDRRALGGDADRVPRPVRLPAARARPARRRVGRRVGDRARSTSSARPSSARSRPASSSSSTRTACARSRRSSLPSTARSASSSSSTSPGPTRTSRASRCTARACAWASDSPRRRRSTRTSSCRSRTRARPRRSASPARRGIPFSEGLIKNRYVGRTFIQPEQGLREQGDQAEVQPARRARGQARRRRRRLDRPREHDAADRADALRRRRDRGARARLGTARDRSVLLRHRLRRPGRADRVGQDRRGDSRAHRRDLARVPLARGPRAVDAPAGLAALPRVPDARLPDRRSGRRDEAQVRARWHSSPGAATSASDSATAALSLVRPGSTADASGMSTEIRHARVVEADQRARSDMAAKALSLGQTTVSRLRPAA